jgi:hypothetical protein
MDALLARYIEGDLAEDEVAAFLEAIERSPQLARELGAYESVLAAAQHPVPFAPGPDFTDRVMAEVSRPDRPSVQARPQRPRWVRQLAAAAAVVMLFSGGWWTARQLGAGLETLAPASSFVVPAAWNVSSGNGVQFVRLVYPPPGPDLDQVSVAGSFNGWDPGSIPMTFDGKVWSAILVLPPGSYEYMFVEDGERWVTDPLAPRTRSDGFGGVNAVLDITV